LREHRFEIAVVIDLFRENIGVEPGLVAKDAALAGFGEDNEFVDSSPPIGPVSARIGIAFNPIRAKVRR
jgi:hypothetical protein